MEQFMKNDSYSNCYADLCRFFHGKSIGTIFSHPYLLYDGGNVRYIKSRLVNSNNGKGKSSGYRIYYYVDKENETVTILGFYPKTGKYGRPDISPSEEKKVIKIYREEKSAGKLVSHDVLNTFTLQV